LSSLYLFSLIFIVIGKPSIATKCITRGENEMYIQALNWLKSLIEQAMVIYRLATVG